MNGVFYDFVLHIRDKLMEGLYFVDFYEEEYKISYP